MIKLRVVGTTPENDALVLSNKPKGKKGSHSLPIDGRLIAVLQGAFDTKRQGDRPPVTSRSAPTAVAPPKVPPREIQRMLRAGMTVVQVARAADMPESYIEQFYPPILYERDGVLRDVQAIHLEKPRRGASGLPLGEAVERNLGQRRVRLSDDELAKAWSATRREGQPWTVSLSFPFRGRTVKATWSFDPRTRALRATNKLALDIGWVADGSTPVVVERPASVTPLPGARKRGGSAKAKPRSKTGAKPKPRGNPRARTSARAPKRNAAAGRKAKPKTTSTKRRPKPTRARATARPKPSARRTSTTRRASSTGARASASARRAATRGKKSVRRTTTASRGTARARARGRTARR